MNCFIHLNPTILSITNKLIETIEHCPKLFHNKMKKYVDLILYNKIEDNKI